MFLDDHDEDDNDLNLDKRIEASGDLKPKNDVPEIGDQEEGIPLMDF